MKQLGLEIIREVSGREKVKRLEFMNKSLWEELRRITKRYRRTYNQTTEEASCLRRPFEAQNAL